MVDLQQDLSILKEFPDRFILGMDEVGRGAFAGPVMMGAVAINYAAFRAPEVAIRDSKLLSPQDRQSIVSFYENDARNALLYSKLVDCDASVIDDLGIEAALDSCFQSLLRMLFRDYQIPYEKMVVILDGDRERARPDELHHVTCLNYPKADDRFVCTALASILAKTKRDADMQLLHQDHPEYGWDENKGYGNPYHREMIAQHGLTLYHRRTFIKS